MGYQEYVPVLFILLKSKFSSTGIIYFMGFFVMNRYFHRQYFPGIFPGHILILSNSRRFPGPGK